jgi:hypothetical protein
VQRGNAFEGLAILHSDQCSVSNGDIFSDLDGCALPAAALAEVVVGRSFNRNRPMVLRELHVDEGKFPAARIDARDERVVPHKLFCSQSVKDSCWNARENSGVGNSSWQQLAIF